MQRWQARAATALVWGTLCCAGAGSQPSTAPEESSATSQGPVSATPGSALWAGPPGGRTSALASVDPGYPLAGAVDRACPAGTRETQSFDCIYEKRGGPPPPCACEYVCTPGCGAGEVCTPDDSGAVSCQCHAALEPSASGCSWSGLLQNGTFDGAQGWELQREGGGVAPVARIDAGELELSVTERCGLAWAGTTARLPARDQFPEGAALVFDYSARGAIVSTHTFASALIDGFVAGQPLQPEENGSERRCVALRDRPWLASLEFRVQVGGVCGFPVDYALTVDNVRLEADPSCR